MKNDLVGSLSKAFLEHTRDMAQRFAVEFASVATEVLREASVEQLLALAGAERRAAPRKAARVKRTSKAATARQPIDADALLKRVVAVVKANPKGVAAEDIKSQLGLSRSQWRKVSTVGLKSGAIRQRGERRAARYTAGK